MKKIRFLREIVILLVCIIVVGIVMTIKNIYYDVKAYDHLENAIVYLYEEDNANVLKTLNKAFDEKDESIYEVINALADEEILEDFYKDKTGVSFGYAEYRDATLLIYGNKIGEAIDKLKEAVKQGNAGAAAFLADYLESLKRYTEAFEYYEKAYELKNYTITRKYMDMKNNLSKYKEMEDLFIKYNQNTISDEDRYVLGRFLLEQEDILDAYKVLKPFLEFDNIDALYAKASYLEIEGELDQAMMIYRNLYNKHKHTKSALKVLQAQNISTIKARNRVIDMLKDIKVFDKDVEYVKANLLFENDKWSEAKEIYDKLYALNYEPVYRKLAKYYENSGDLLNAIKLYTQAFESGEIDVAINIYDLTLNLEAEQDIKLEKDYMEYLKIASNLGNSAASYKLSEIATTEYDKKKYAIIALGQGEIRALETLVSIAVVNKEKEKIQVFTNVLINNK